MQQKVMARRACSRTSENGDAAAHITRWLANRIGTHKFGMWFGHARVSVQGKRVEIATDSPFAARWIGSNFIGEISDAAREAIGVEPEVEVISSAPLGAPDPLAANGAPAAEAAGHASSAARPNGAANGRAPRPKVGQAGRRLEDFVVGSSNRLAWSAACRIAEDADPRLHSPLFLHGSCGVGKTHLLLGVCHRFSGNWPSARVRYVPAEQFTNEYIAAVRNGKIDEVRRRLRKLDLLAIDDVHFLSNKMRTQTEFLHTLDAIAMGGARVVLASDGHPRQITSLNQALISRFMSGMVVQIELPDRELRASLVQRIAAERGLPLSEAAAEAIAVRCVGSARELEGAIAKLAAMRAVSAESANGNAATPQGGVSSAEPIGMLLIEQLFSGTGAGQSGAWHPAAPVRIADVMDTVCNRMGVIKSDLMGSGRHQRIVLARALVAHLARQMTTMSYPEIAQAMGRKYHSTIHTAAQRLGRQLAAGERLPANGVAGRADESMPLVDFVDQLRHEIGRATSSNRR